MTNHDLIVWVPVYDYGRKVRRLDLSKRTRIINAGSFENCGTLYGRHCCYRSERGAWAYWNRDRQTEEAERVHDVRELLEVIS